MNKKSSKVTIWVCLILAIVGLIAGLILVLLGLKSSEGVDSVQFIAGIMVLIMAVAFLICMPVVAIGSKNQRRQFDKITAFMKQNAGENAVFLAGKYRKKGDRGKAAAESAASIAGAALFAAFFGFGVYAIYSASKPAGFILDDSGLFVFNPAEPMDEVNVVFTSKGYFNKCTIKESSNKIILKDLLTKEIFTMRLTDNSTTISQVANRLKELVNAKPANTSAQRETPISEYAVKDNSKTDNQKQ